jgi:hypothetical protein
MKSRIVKGSNVPSVNLSKEIIAVLSRLDADEVKEIIVGIRDYVYKDKEPMVNEEITDIMDMTLDNINHIAKGYLNGKKGGRPKKSTLQEVTTTEFDIPKTGGNVENENKADLSPSNDEEIEQPQPIGDNATESLKIGKDDIKINLTEKEINEVMGTYKGTIEELNKRTTINDFSSIDRLVPKLNREMVLKQVKPYLSKEKNIGRLNEALSIFLKDVSLDDRTKYYEFLLDQSFAVA